MNSGLTADSLNQVKHSFGERQKKKLHLQYVYLLATAFSMFEPNYGIIRPDHRSIFHMFKKNQVLLSKSTRHRLGQLVV